MNAVDLIILAMIILPAILGLFKGLVLTVAGPVAALVNWYGALRLCPYTVKWLYTLTPLVKSVGNMASKSRNPGIAAHAILVITGFVLCFLLIKIIIKIIISLVNSVAKLPGLNVINSVGGLAAGLAEGLIIVCFIFLILSLAKDALPAAFMTAINGSKLGSWFLTDNPLAGILPVKINKLYKWKGKIL